MKVTQVSTVDIRVETSLNKLGRDRVHRNPDPDYSAAVLELGTDSGITGRAHVFTLGSGNRWLCQMMEEFAKAQLLGMDIEQFRQGRGAFWRSLVEHGQLRWHGQSGMYREVVGALVNAVWDLDAKDRGLPLCDLLEGLSESELVSCVDWTHLSDRLDAERALELLEASASERRRLKRVEAYLTRGWAGLDMALLRDGLTTARANGFLAAKQKVGDSIEEDEEVYRVIREIMGEDALVMTDANQFFSLPRAMEYLQELGERGICYHWLEEMCHNDDIAAHQALQGSLSRFFRLDDLPILVGGEHCGNQIIAKQFIYGDAYGAFQIDAARVAGVNEVLAIMMMAADRAIPVCPHGGGIGLCNYIVHYGFFDQGRLAPQSFLVGRAQRKRRGVPASKLRRMVEYLDFLQEEAFVYPVRVVEGHYLRPTAPGWGIEMRPEFVEEYRYPDGKHWRTQQKKHFIG